MTRRSVVSALLAAVLAAAPGGVPGTHAATAPAKSATAKPAPKPVLPFIADDLDRAIAEAKRRDLPLFIESWAPW